jgi:hypothetical protein
MFTILFPDATFVLFTRPTNLLPKFYTPQPVNHKSHFCRFQSHDSRE